MSAAGFDSMSARLFSNLPPRIPLPTMFRRRARVFDRSMIFSLKSAEVPPARASRVRDRGDADAKRSRRVEAVVARAQELRSPVPVDVRVNVDEAGRHINRTHPPSSTRRRIELAATRSFARDGDVAHGADLLRASMTCPPRRQQIVFLLDRRLRLACPTFDARPCATTAARHHTIPTDRSFLFSASASVPGPGGASPSTRGTQCSFRRPDISITLHFAGERG